MIQISGDFSTQGRKVSFPFQKDVGVFLVSFGVGWGVRGLSVVSLVRGVVIVGLLCVYFLLAQHLLPQSQHEHVGAFSLSAATAAA